MSRKQFTLSAEQICEYIEFDDALGRIVCAKAFGARKPGDVIDGTFSVFGSRMTQPCAAWIAQNGELPLGLVLRNNADGGLSVENLVDLGVIDMSGHVMSQEFLRDILKYCPASGLMSWLKTISTRAKKGQIAGCDNGSGYRKITIGKTQYLEHRLAYLYIYGVMPENVDHKNGVRSDNRIENLRYVTPSENQHNRRRASSSSLSGFLGVGTYKSGRFDARLQVGERNIYLGRFDSPEEAHRAYVAAKRREQPGNLL